MGLTAIPLLSTGQSFFYNKGKMSIINTDTTKTVLYVKGDFIAARDATDPSVKSDIVVSGSKTVITGDFYQNTKYVSGNNGNVFSRPASGYQNAKFVFRGTTAQKIFTALDANDTSDKYSAIRKGTNFVDFPDIEVANPDGVIVHPELAISAQNIFLTQGKLVLDSRKMNSTDVTADPSASATKQVVANSTLMAHLQLDGTVKYKRTATNPGVIQVNLDLDDKVTTSSDAVEKAGRSIVGMGSPFKEIRADYFMWNFLMFPAPDGNIFGVKNKTEADPTTVIPAGKGFVLGVDLRGPNVANYTNVANIYKQTDFDARFTDRFTFDRFAFDTKNNIYPLATNGNGAAAVAVTDAAYAKEEIVDSDVQMNLVEGYNYLSNPFLTPLKLDDIIAANGSSWGVLSGDASVTNRDVVNRVWVLSPSSKGSGLFDLNTGAPLYKSRIHATYTYLLMKDTGSTYDDGSGNPYTIAPLQMFVVYSPGKGTATTIKIPKAARQISAGSQFLRSAETEKRDDFLFEVADLKTNVTDRASVVLRTPHEIMTNPSYSDNVKKLVTSVVASDDTKSADLRVVTEEGTVSQSANSLIYTKAVASDDKEYAYASRFVAAPEGATTVLVPLYLTPSLTPQDIAIRAMRLNSMDNVDEVWLDDAITKKSFELSSGKDYLTSVKPTDRTDRFVLRFEMASSGIDDETEENVNDRSISSYYANGTLTVTGFESADYGSVVSVYDIQGRMVAQSKVAGLSVEVRENFAPGAYIVKVVGNKSYVSKFLVR